MAALTPSTLSPAERAKRSILVGNIPRDTTEQQLRNLLLEFGSILNFRFFNDSAGNQIGYAFCEFEYQEMALRALRGLMNLQFRGQVLKVETAVNDNSQEEVEASQAGGSNEVRMENLSELDATTEKAPEEITKAVASLPPEQMFELMKQMKVCIENNPHEARNLLLQNPQLAYALLQAQVIMRIVDPHVAVKILDRPIPEPLNDEISDGKNVPETLTSVGVAANNSIFPAGISQGPNIPSMPLHPSVNLFAERSTASTSQMDFSTPNDHDMRQMFGDSNMRMFNTSEVNKHRFDQRFQTGIDPRLMQGQNVRNQDPRMAPGPDPRGIQGFDPRLMQFPPPRTMQDPDPRIMQGLDPRAKPGPGPRLIPGTGHRMMQGPDVASSRVQGFDPRNIQSSDPRMNPSSDPRMAQALDSQHLLGVDPRSISKSDPRAMRGQDPRIVQNPVSNPRMGLGIDPRMISGPNFKLGGPDGRPGVDPRAVPTVDPRVVPGLDPRMSGADPRARQSFDPRIKQDPRKPPISDDVPGATGRLPAAARAPLVITSTAPENTGGPHSTETLPNMSPHSAPQDQEKAALIMQVLQLSDEQIAMLPQDQRQSILILKEQIARSHLA